MTEPVDMHWSFRSPNSYLVIPDLRRLRQVFEVNVPIRVVLPIALRNPSLLFDAGDRKKSRYIALDANRPAEFLGLTLRLPARPDPIVQDFATMQIAEEQPYIYHLSALGVEVERRGRGLELVTEVSALIFGGTDGWDQGDQLKDAVMRDGLELAELDAAMVDGDHLDEIERDQRPLEAAGHWGVPTTVARGEPFFSHHRIDRVRWRLDQYGLKRA